MMFGLQVPFDELARSGHFGDGRTSSALQRKYREVINTPTKHASLSIDKLLSQKKDVEAKRKAAQDAAASVSDGCDERIWGPILEEWRSEPDTNEHTRTDTDSSDDTDTESDLEGGDDCEVHPVDVWLGTLEPHRTDWKEGTMERALKQATPSLVKTPPPPSPSPSTA
eukprot:COSAG05_NODE_7833_length_765_cov_0.857357_1_plen_167_part_10